MASWSIVITNNYEKYGFPFPRMKYTFIEASAPICVYVQLWKCVFLLVKWAHQKQILGLPSWCCG